MILSRMSQLLGIDRFRNGKRKPFARRFARRECVCMGALELTQVGAEYPGVLLEVSEGGCSFRPASHFLLDRTGAAVVVRCPYFVVEGRIRATRPEAYGVQFFWELETADVERLLEASGGALAASHLARRVVDEAA